LRKKKRWEHSFARPGGGEAKFSRENPAGGYCPQRGELPGLTLWTKANLGSPGRKKQPENVIEEEKRSPWEESINCRGTVTVAMGYFCRNRGKLKKDAKESRMK